MWAISEIGRNAAMARIVSNGRRPLSKLPCWTKEGEVTEEGEAYSKVMANPVIKVQPPSIRLLERDHFGQPLDGIDGMSVEFAKGLPRPRTHAVEPFSG